MKSEVPSPKSESPWVLVCFALEEEAQALKWRPWVWSSKVLFTGIGVQNARSAVSEALTDKCPRRVFTCGFAGGLNPALVLGDVVFETQQEALAQKLTANGAKPVKFHCALRIAVTATEKAELWRTTGADAVEMESAAIQSLCHERGIPCATVRVVSDTANEDLPLDFNQLAKPDLSLDYGKLALAIAKSPGKISALLRLRKQTRFAAERLAGVLGKVLWP